ncbi:MAG: hypothetical protein KDA81_14225, partial [Planctomycetaceae bacterium]|nr:hypothetical protein [Planctomycetaceae bacterium]
MSSPSTSAGTYAECEEFIDYQLQVARDRIRWTDLLTAVLLIGVLVLGYILAFTVFDHWFVQGGFSSLSRGLMLMVVSGTCAGIAWRFILRPWSHQVHPLFAARMLDRKDDVSNGTLVSLVDLRTSGGSVSEPVINSMEKRAAVHLAGLNVDEMIDRRLLMRLGVLLFCLVLATCLYAVFSPKSIDLLRAFSTADAAVATTTRILKVSPGHQTIHAGSTVEFTVDISGKIPENIQVLYTTRDRTSVDTPLTMEPGDADGRYHVLLSGDGDRGLRQDFTYFVIAGDAVSERYTITVDQPPTAHVEQLKCTYPDYMGLPIRHVDGGNIDVWEGTEIEVTAKSNVPLSTAVLRFSDTPTFDVQAEDYLLNVNGMELSGRLKLNLREDGTSARFYRIEVIDEAGRTDPSPTVYSVNVRPDRAPVIRLLDPIRDLRAAANAVIPMLVEAQDPDFLLRSVKLEFEVNGEARTPQLLFDATREGDRREWSGVWEFSLESLGVQEGDVIRYSVAARDNHPPLGRLSRTGTLQIDVQAAVTPERAREQLREDRQLQDQQFRRTPSDTETETPHHGDDKQDNPPKDDDGKAPSEIQENRPDVSADGQTDGSGERPNEGGNGAQERSNGTQGSGDEKRTDGAGESGERSGKTGETAKSGEAADGMGKSTGVSSEESGDGQSSQPDSSGTATGSQSGQRPSDDNDALQKLIDRYKGKMDSETTDHTGHGGAESDQRPPTSDNRNEGRDQSSTTGSRMPAEGDAPNDSTSSSASQEIPAKQSDSESSGADSATESGREQQNSDGSSERGASAEDKDSPNASGDKSETGADAANDATRGEENSAGEKQDPSAEQQNGNSSNSGQDDSSQMKPDQQGQQSGQQGQQSGQQGQQSGHQGQQSGQQGQQSGQQGQQ